MNTSEASPGSSPLLSVTTDLGHETASSTTQIISDDKMDDFLEGALQERLESETSTSLLIAELTGLKSRLEDCKFRSLVDNAKSPLLTDACQVSHGKKSLVMDQKVLAASVSAPTSEIKIKAVYENALKSSKLAALNLKRGLAVSRHSSEENLKITSQPGIHIKESKRNQAGNSSNFVVPEQKSENMRDSAGLSTILNRSPAKAVQNRACPLHEETGYRSDGILMEPCVTRYISGSGASTSKNTWSLTSRKNEPAILADLCESDSSLPTSEQAVIGMSPAKEKPTLGYTSPTTILMNTSEASLGSIPLLSVTTDLVRETASSTTQIISEDKMDDFLEGALQERLENETSTTLLIAELTGLKSRLEDCKFQSLVDNAKSPLLMDACQVSHGKNGLVMDQKVLAASVSGPTTEIKIKADYESALKSSKLAALNLKKTLAVSRHSSEENLKITRGEDMVKNEREERTPDAHKSIQNRAVIQDASSSMKNTKASDTTWKCKAEASLCKTKENMNDNTGLQIVEAFTPFPAKNTNVPVPAENKDRVNKTFMVKHRERQMNLSSVKDCESTRADGGLCLHGEHTEMLVMDSSMNIKPPSRSTVHSRKSFSTSLLSSESSQSKKFDHLPPVKHVSALAYRKDKRLILQSLRNRQKKNLLNLSERERRLLASIERLDVKLASTVSRGDSSSISMISDGNSVKSAPTVMQQLGSRQGSRPWKILRHPLRPLSSFSAALPLKRRQNVGLTNKSRENTNSCSHSNERKVCQSSFLGPQLEVMQPAIGTIHIHQDPRFLLSS